MPKTTVNTKFFEFRQNNSGGSWNIEDESGIGPRVWIEATNARDALARAENIGIYFDGVRSGRDCGCCGDRWSDYLHDDDGKEKIELCEYSFHWHPVVYLHRLDGSIERSHKDDWIQKQLSADT